ncbi:hypothetical protein [Muriicola sp.]|uniref:hypothetical protein n=1 Tax=Muriicola sp. TaxID=2020856 RepID=UPI003C718941
MKQLFLYIILVFSFITSYSQVSGQISGGAGAAFGLNGRTSTDAFLATHMANLRQNKNTTGESEILGSPYLTEDFVKSKLFFGDEYVGDYYVRYNALNSEIEIKETQLPGEEAKRLLANEDLRVKYGQRELLFTTYINKKEETKNGYLSIISSGNEFTLYHRLAVKFSEGKAAANSMVMAIPSRYAHFVEYYYMKAGVDRIDQLTQKKGALLKILEKEMKEPVNNFIKENKIDLDNEEHLIKTFEFINSLNTSS